MSLLNTLQDNHEVSVGLAKMIGTILEDITKNITWRTEVVFDEVIRMWCVNVYCWFDGSKETTTYTSNFYIKESYSAESKEDREDVARHAGAIVSNVLQSYVTDKFTVKEKELYATQAES